MLRKALDSTARNAVNLIYKVSDFLINPGTLGKSELGQTLNQLMRYADGVILPKDNCLVKRLMALKKTMAPDGCMNKTILEDLAAAFGGRFWEIPGLKTTFTLESGTPKLRQDLGSEFDKWAGRRAVRATEGLYVETALRTDPHKTTEWTENFNLNAILSSKGTVTHYTDVSNYHIKTIHITQLRLRGAATC